MQNRERGDPYLLGQEIFSVNRLFLAMIAVLSAAVFVVDIFIPLGVSGGVVYVLLVMATYWVKGKSITTGTGVLATLLTIAGFWFSVSSEYILLSGANHGMTIIIIWASVWFVNNYKASLSQLRRNYRTLFKATTDEILVYQLDDDGHPEPFIEVNDTACAILGYSRDELLQKSVYDIVAADNEEIDRRIRQVMKNGEAVYETRHTTKDGGTIPLELSLRLFIYNGRKTIISIGRDLRERRMLEREILNISEKERLRIGQDMHDDLGQLLTVTKMSAQQLEFEMKAKGMQEAEKLKEIVELVDKAGKSARTIAHGLVPVQMESDGLDSALDELARNTSNLYNIEVHYSGDSDDYPIDTSSAVHMYRIAQEAINNAVKHAQATTIEVDLTSAGDYVSMCIRDNGSGFNSGALNGGRGLRIMKFRSNMIDGNLIINSKRGEGTEVICQVPKKTHEFSS